MHNRYTAGELIDIEMVLLKECRNAIEEEREFTEEEQLYYNAFSEIQALRLYKQKKEKKNENLSAAGRTAVQVCPAE